MSKVIVKSVKVEKAPGFKSLEGPELKNFENGLNIIYGTNGSGKTTLSKALQASLWENKEIENFQVETEASFDNEDWKIIRKGSNLEQTNLQTNQVEKLFNRKDEYAVNYNFSIIDLLESNANLLKEKINKELNFGVDFDNLRKNLDLSRKERLGVVVSKNYYQMKIDLEKAEAEIKEAETLQQDREEIKEKIRQLGTKIKEYEDIETKIDIKAKMLEKKKLEEELANYPPFMNELSKGNLKVFEEKEESLSKNKTKLKTKEDLISTCVKELENTHFLESKVEEDGYDFFLSSKINKLEILKNAYNECKKEQELKEKELNRWLDNNKFFVETLPLKDGTQASIALLTTLEKDYERRANLKEASKQLVEAYKNKEEGDEEEIEKTFSSIKGKVTSKNKPLVYTLYLLILGFGLLATSLSPWFCFGLVACLIALFIINQKKVDFLSLKEEIIKLTDLKLSKEKNELLEKASEAYEKNTQALEEWLKEWEKTCGELGLNTMKSTFSSSKFYDYGIVLKQGIALKEDYEKSKDAFNLSQENFKTFKTEIGQKLEINCLDYDFLTLEEKLNKEKESFKKYLELKKGKENLENDIINLNEEIKEDSKIVDEFWKELNLMPSQRYKIEEYRGKYDDFINEKVRYELLSKELEKKESFVNELEEIEIETLKNKKIERDAFHTRKEELNKLEGIKKEKYERAIENEKYKNTLKNLEEEKDKLKDLRKKELEMIFCRQICEEVENSNVENNQPVIIKKANEWLAKITKQTFKLFYNKGFYVRDVNKKDNFKFEELSSGTRVQVLLSLRLGALEVLEEEGASYPLFFDETLANSDDERSLAISQALHELSKQRQVFYFTAQSEEVEKLKQQYKENVEKVGYYNLDVEKKEQKQSLKPFKFYKEKNKIPLPSNFDECPKFLKLSNPDLFEKITNLSIFYVFNDVKTLSFYYNLDFEKIGQLKETAKPEIQEIIKALEKSQEFAQKGRCRVLHKEDLENAQIEGINTGANYWADILEQVSLSNSGKDLVTQMENGSIKRLGDDKIENIKNYLINQEFYTAEKPLDKAEILLLTLKSIESKEQSQIKQIIDRYLGMVLNV
ncbi:MAG: AAA family ATPase [Sphaerochaetaceae bacterium]|nr:AAA family ATPase [Sphaerochaetaceae bacterium]